jgi:hypothetical protein
MSNTDTSASVPASREIENRDWATNGLGRLRDITLSSESLGGGPHPVVSFTTRKRTGTWWVTIESASVIARSMT